MNKFLKNGIATLSVSISLAVTNPVLASKQLDIDRNTSSFKDRELISGPIKVLVKYEQQDNINSDTNNLYYQIFYNGVPQINSSDFTAIEGSVTLKDLDGDGRSEVLIKTFSGGAHCCTKLKIYSWNDNKFSMLETGLLDGDGGTFQDLDRDGKFEFVTFDNSFLYMFSSHGGSFPPSKIYAFKKGGFENVTRKYVKYLSSQAGEMYQAFLQRKREKSEVNGILAGYVAQKALLGEYQQAWEFMLANYDRTSDWGLEVDQGNGKFVRYPNFPTALKAFLIKQGYLSG